MSQAHPIHPPALFCKPSSGPARCRRSLWLGALFGVCCLHAGSPSAAAKTNDWSFTVTPYLWVAGIQTDTTLPDFPPSTPPSATQFDTRITGGAMLGTQVRYRSVGLWLDFDWLRLNSKASSPGPAFASVDLQADFIHSTAALSYRLPLKGKFHADLLAGSRLWHVSEQVAADAGTLPGFTASSDNTWVDPVVGADLRFDLSPRWALVAKGTAGGLDTTSDFGWEVMGGVSYRCRDFCSVAFGYRYLHQEYDKDRFTLNTDIQGFILGVGFHF